MIDFLVVQYARTDGQQVDTCAAFALQIFRRFVNNRHLFPTGELLLGGVALTANAPFRAPLGSLCATVYAKPQIGRLIWTALITVK